MLGPPRPQSQHLRRRLTFHAMTWPLLVLTVLSWPHSWAPSALPTHVPALPLEQVRAVWDGLSWLPAPTLGAKGSKALGQGQSGLTGGSLGSTTG